MKTLKLTPKMMTRAFGKDIYLLGTDSDGIRYWLEEPKWDCGWYWGFGYVETYTCNSNPYASRDIASHSHISSILEGVSNFYESKMFDSVTFSEDESWKLTELFRQFYLLKEMAEFSHKTLPGCHVTESPVNHGDLSEWNKKINEVMIPAITKAIIDILNPMSSGSKSV